MAFEPAVALDYLRATLANNMDVVAALPGGVWRGVAPEKTATPFATLSVQGTSDVAGVSGIRLWNSGAYQVTVSAPASQMSALVSAASLIDAALHRTSGATADGAVLSCVREQALPLDEVVDGVLWTHLKSFWRIQAQ